jgi:hypothetical protein
LHASINGSANVAPLPLRVVPANAGVVDKNREEAAITMTASFLREIIYSSMCETYVWKKSIDSALTNGFF